ncbi:MAG: ATP-dependent 6-phosphofructokinase [Malacoplasma sp.]|nr:ATP-dependent 6-phosphofructokinase [Malacoplasma sp.]
MKRIAILTSGGDASSMNRCLSAFAAFTAGNTDLEILYVFGGYKGLWNDQIYKVNYTEVRTWYNLPGTKIYSSRFPEMKQEEYRLKMVDNLKKHKIDYLVVIGGDGSYQGALKLSELGVKVICMPGTIDNDVKSTTYSIGFDSSLNKIVDSVNSIKSCMQSHGNIAIIEVMGRRCSDLTVFAGIATDADIVITWENMVSPEKLLELVREKRKINKRGMIILVSELLMGQDGYPTMQEYANYIMKYTNEKVKANILGHMQRDGNPTAMDMIRATILTKKAIEIIQEDEFNKVIGLNEFEPVVYKIEEGLNLEKPSRLDLIEKYIA